MTRVHRARVGSAVLALVGVALLAAALFFYVTGREGDPASALRDRALAERLALVVLFFVSAIWSLVSSRHQKEMRNTEHAIPPKI